jgi:hypothetical protein
VMSGSNFSLSAVPIAFLEHDCPYSISLVFLPLVSRLLFVPRNEVSVFIQLISLRVLVLWLVKYPLMYSLISEFWTGIGCTSISFYMACARPN